MNILVNMFHPDLSSSNVNAAWVDALNSKANVTLNQQYDCYADWQIDVAREQQLLSAHDVIVFQFPFLWYSVPPLMKKWFDDVLTHGWAYGTGGEALKGKTALLATSTGCAAESYQVGGDNNYTMSDLLKPVQQTIELTHMLYAQPFIFHSAVGASENQIAESSNDYLSRISLLSNDS